MPPRWCPRLVVAVGLACSNDLKSYAGGSVATGRVSQAEQVKSEVPDRERPWSSRLGVGHWVDIPVS
jgi:hypothetical protein